jgi:hypothetical protein
MFASAIAADPDSVGLEVGEYVMLSYVLHVSRIGLNAD